MDVLSPSCATAHPHLRLYPLGTEKSLAFSAAVASPASARRENLLLTPLSIDEVCDGASSRPVECLTAVASGIWLSCTINIFSGGTWRSWASGDWYHHAHAALPLYLVPLWLYGPSAFRNGTGNPVASAVCCTCTAQVRIRPAVGWTGRRI